MKNIQNARNTTQDDALARSHSAASNAKLTLIALLGALCFAALFALIGLALAKQNPLFWVGTAVVCVLLLLDVRLLSRFRR